MNKLCLKLRLSGTNVQESTKTQDSIITTRFRGVVVRPDVAGFSPVLAKAVFDEKAWGSSLSTGWLGGPFKMTMTYLEAGGFVPRAGMVPGHSNIAAGDVLAEVPHCFLKDLKFSLKVIKEKGKEPVSVVFVTVLVEHENNPAQKAIVCAVPSNLEVQLEPEAEPERKAVPCDA